VLVAVADKGRPELALLCVIPILVFFALDSYYLALEKGFRASYNRFVAKLHDEKLVASDIFAVNPDGVGIGELFESAVAGATWPVYLTLLGLTILARYAVFR
jgi:hypothetical protein